MDGKKAKAVCPKSIPGVVKMGHFVSIDRKDKLLERKTAKKCDYLKFKLSYEREKSVHKLA